MQIETMMSSEKHDWCTPEPVLERVRRLAPIGLDPCTTIDNPCKASDVYLVSGLDLPWTDYGLVYVNPPYGRELPKWAEKAVSEAANGVEIIMLVPSRTDTRWWGYTYDACQSVAFWKGRLTFVGAPSAAPFPSSLFYFGTNRRRFGQAFRDVARVVVGGHPLPRVQPANDTRQQVFPFEAAS